MKREYDFTNSRPNPYLRRLKRQISIRIDTDTIAYFKGLSESMGIPYQQLMNMYLADCASRKLVPATEWVKR
jgi:antitoxin component of RelBE/YafQ-DinJ toxin-antitoxin module